MKRLLVTLLTFTSWACLAQGTNSIFPAQTFTASGQTGAAIQLNRAANASTIGSSFNVGTITVTGTFSTLTFAVQGSSDNGVTYYALPISTVAAPGSTPSTTVTATAGGLYQINLTGITHVQFVTSGTFTGTSASLVLTASPNGSLARGPCAGCAQIPAGQVALPILNASACSTSFAPSWCSGGEIGAWVMSAVTKLNAHPGKILVDATQATWPQSTPIVLPMSVQLDCQSSPLVWQGTSGAALAVASVFASSSSPYLTAVSNCYFQGPGSVSTSTNIGVYVGADPAGIITPSNTQGSGIIFDNVKIYGFNTGWTNGSNAFIISLHHVDIEDNYNNIVSVGPGTAGVVNSGENMVLDSASVIANGTNYGMYFNGFNSRWHITDTSFDYNVGGNIFGNVNASFKSIHSEAAAGCHISVPANANYNMQFYGGDWQISGTTGTFTGLICMPTRNAQGVISLDGGLYIGAAAGVTLTNFINTGGTTPLNLCPAQFLIQYNFVITNQSPFVVDSGSTYCNNLGNSTAGTLTLNNGHALGTSQMLAQGSMVTSGGTGSTLVPFWLLQPGGPTLVSTWGSAGTVFGINAPNGYGGDIISLHVGGQLRVFRVLWSGQTEVDVNGSSIVPLILNNLNTSPSADLTDWEINGVKVAGVSNGGAAQFTSFTASGTTFTVGGCGTPTSLAGGASGGSFVAQATACSAVINTGITVPHGYVCTAWDITTPADTFKETAYSTGTVTLTGTVVIGDTIVFGCTSF